jgi:hypothetical protein
VIGSAKPAVKVLFYTCLILSLGGTTSIVSAQIQMIEKEQSLGRFLGQKFKKLIKKIEERGPKTTIYFDGNLDGTVDIVSQFRGQYLISQKIDQNGDGEFDRFISNFPNQKTFKIVKIDGNFDGKIDQMVFSKEDEKDPNFAIIRRLVDVDGDGIFEKKSSVKVSRIQSAQYGAPKCQDINFNSRVRLQSGLEDHVNDVREIFDKINAGGVKESFFSGNSLKFNIKIDRKCQNDSQMSHLTNPDVLGEGLKEGLTCLNKLDEDSRRLTDSKGRSLGLIPAVNSGKHGNLQLSKDAGRPISMARVNFVNLITTMAVKRKFYGQGLAVGASGARELADSGFLVTPRPSTPSSPITAAQKSAARLQIVCSENSANFEGETVYGRASSDPAHTIQCGSGKTKVNAPFVSLNTEAIKNELSDYSKYPNEDAKKNFVKKTFFHESMHLLGYQHGQGVEYPESCARCAFDSGCNSEETHCKICMGTFTKTQEGQAAYGRLISAPTGYAAPNDPNRGYYIQSNGPDGVLRQSLPMARE